jgi:hypothetical protein
LKNDMALKTAALAFCLFFAWFELAQAHSARNCGPRDLVIEKLASGYGETRQSIGLGQNNAIVELFAARTTGTWTITVTTPDGVTCLVASGDAFETLAETLPDAGSDA